MVPQPGLKKARKASHFLNVNSLLNIDYKRKHFASARCFCIRTGGAQLDSLATLVSVRYAMHSCPKSKG